MIMGIDNGLDGGIVILRDDGSIVGKHVMPTLDVAKSRRDYNINQVCRIVEHAMDGLELREVFVERAQSMPGQGVRSMFMTGYGFGIMLGILGKAAIPYTVVSPQTWMKVMFLGLPKEGKDTTKLVCSRIWPKEDWKASIKCRVAHDGLCDAALIAEYGRRLRKGGPNV